MTVEPCLDCDQGRDPVTGEVCLNCDGTGFLDDADDWDDWDDEEPEDEADE